MDESLELLEYIYACADMGMKSTEKLLKILKEKDNKIKKVLESEMNHPAAEQTGYHKVCYL